MNFYSVLRRGCEHKEFCEDFLITHDSEQFFFGAIFDGCSSGKNSHFASTLFGMTLRRVLNTNLHYYKNLTQDNRIDTIGYMAIRGTSQSLYKIKHELDLQESELLSTVLLMIYDKKNDVAAVIAIGDGVIQIDDQIHLLDQSNEPQYLTYQLDKIYRDDNLYKQWWEGNEVQIFKHHNPQSIAISSDGIQTFADYAPVEIKDLVDPVKFLIENRELIGHHNMLNRKCNILNTKYKQTHKDDLSIIRLELKETEIVCPPQLQLVEER